MQPNAVWPQGIGNRNVFHSTHQTVPRYTLRHYIRCLTSIEFIILHVSTCMPIASGITEVPEALCRPIPGQRRSQCCLKPRSHMYCNLSATALRLKNSCNQCNHCAIKNCIFRLQINRRLVGDNYPLKSATSRRSVGDWWAIDCQLIGNRLWLVGNWLATGRRQVGDELATDYRTNNLLCKLGVIMNKALINCYSMAFSMSIMSYCLFVGYFLVRVYID